MASPLYEHALKLLAHRPHSVSGGECVMQGARHLVAALVCTPTPAPLPRARRRLLDSAPSCARSSPGWCSARAGSVRLRARRGLAALRTEAGRDSAARAGPVSYTLQDVDGALEALTTTGQLDDAEFAAWYREQRQRFRPRAAVVLRQELRSKMVPEPYISAQLAMYDEEEACRRAALKKAHYDEHRLRMYLLRNGYGMGLVRGTVEWMREQRAPVPGGPEHARPEYWEQQAEAAAAGGQPSDESSDSGDDEADGDGDAGVRAAARPRPAGFVRGRASRIKSKVRDPMFDGEGEV